jgi:hypothetical protein
VSLIVLHSFKEKRRRLNRTSACSLPNRQHPKQQESADSSLEDLTVKNFEDYSPQRFLLLAVAFVELVEVDSVL